VSGIVAAATVPNFRELMIVKTYECFVEEKLN
jgi:hypothetical protein